VDRVVRVAIALGANLDNPRAHIDRAVTALRSLLDGLVVSSIITTAPEDVSEPQPDYLNAAAVGETTLPARELLARLHAIEAEAGRTRSTRNAARTLDLDLILYGDAVIDEAGLVVPHPRFRSRRFVLAPLAEIAPELRDPATGLSVRTLLERLPDPR
jgi:2-amino-4-hydroxy-6-hydroxymethyldihydropteridine diphosphokinase